MSTNDPRAQLGQLTDGPQNAASHGYSSGGRRLDMLTEQDLRRIIREELRAMLPPVKLSQWWWCECCSYRLMQSCVCCVLVGDDAAKEAHLRARNLNEGDAHDDR